MPGSRQQLARRGRLSARGSFFFVEAGRRSLSLACNRAWARRVSAYKLLDESDGIGAGKGDQRSFQGFSQPTEE